MDERDKPTGRLVSPIEWSSVLFLFTDHLGLTMDPAFTDNILYFLFERPLHKMTEEQVVKEMGVFGLEWTDTLDFLPWQHMMVFTKVE